MLKLTAFQIAYYFFQIAYYYHIIPSKAQHRLHVVAQVTSNYK